MLVASGKFAKQSNKISTHTMRNKDSKLNTDDCRLTIHKLIQTEEIEIEEFYQIFAESKGPASFE
jgi:hypothetical protein